MHSLGPALLALLIAGTAAAQEVRINEVLCAHATEGADWIELYNAGSRPLDLKDYTLALNGASHSIASALPLPAKGVVQLWCDRRTSEGPTHLGIKLPRTGGTALLIAPDRSTVLDVFTWPSLPDDISIGRVQDGQRTWGFFDTPTPNALNTTAHAASRSLQPPVITVIDGTINITAAEGASVHYTTDGTRPTRSSPLDSGPFAGTDGAVVRARAFSPDAIPSIDAVSVPQHDAGSIALVLDPFDLWDPERGLIVDSDAANFARTGPEWVRAAWIAGADDTLSEALPVGLAVSGSGTRGRPKKNLKVFARDRFGSRGPFRSPDGRTNNELMLRADASPNAFLRNMFLEAVAVHSNAHVDVQPSEAHPLYLNGAYQGLYRSMPAKNAMWLEQRSGAEAVDIVEGPGGHVLHGKALTHAAMVDAILHGAPLDTLRTLLDVNSLIDLACFDLWTGRADHDLNVRCWRPRTAEGRWRWVMFDMDLWAPVRDNTVDRMCSAAAPETPYLPQLLAHPDLRSRLLARLSALLATTLSPERAIFVADSIFHRNAVWMHADHGRWKAEMAPPAPEESLADLTGHINGRPAPLLAQLARYTGQPLRTLSVSAEPAGAGTIVVEELPLTSERCTMQAFAGAPLHFTALAAPGMEFAGWKGADDGPLTVDPAKVRNVTARFRPVGLSRQNRLQQRGE